MTERVTIAVTGHPVRCHKDGLCLRPTGAVAAGFAVCAAGGHHPFISPLIRYTRETGIAVNVVSGSAARAAFPAHHSKSIALPAAMQLRTMPVANQGPHARLECSRCMRVLETALLPMTLPRTYIRDSTSPARKTSPTGTHSMIQPFVNIPDDGIAIRARAVRKIYTGAGGTAPKQALEDIDLDIPVGAVFGLLGPNGAGKSTFINIMAGTVIKSAGSIAIWGTDIDDNPRQARANIGIVPQELNIDAYFTPRQQLEFQAGLFGVRPSERRSDEILEMVGLSDQAHTYARRLSGGMRRRLLVAKAMVHSPPILVLDEPTAGVDVALRQRLWDNIRALNEAGVTIVLTTHYLEEAEALCDRIAILNHGRLIANQPKDQLMAGARAKELRMTIAGGTPATMPAALAALDAQPVEGGVLVRYDPAVTGAADIITAVAAAGLEISDVTTVEPDLEDVFLEMTGGMA